MQLLPAFQAVALLAALLFQPLRHFTQTVFCPPGAEWRALYKQYGPYNPSRNGFIKYAGDSLVGTETCKKLIHNSFYGDCNILTPTLTLIRQASDTILFRNSATKNGWRILFVYSATAGQKWSTTYLTYNGTFTTDTTRVDSTGTAVENGMTLKKLYVTHSRLGPLVITERYGWGFLFARFRNTCPNSFHGDQFNGDLCYSDDAFGTRQFSPLPCDYQNPVGLREDEAPDRMVLSPNPAIATDAVFSREGGISECTLEIYSITGRLVDVLTIQNGERAIIPASGYPSGVYLVLLRQKGRAPEARRLVVVN